MKLAKLFVLLAIFLSIFSICVSAQATISDIKDTDLPDVEMLINGTFAERRITGKVVGVPDGDTATVLDENKTQYKFRFNGIDAPELKMDFGNKSKENLSNLIFGKQVIVIFNKVDKYGRYVGKIMVNGNDANLEQIKAGLAWHYKKYANEQSETDRKTYAEAEVKAREAKLGLWQIPNPTAPWAYRADKKVNQESEKANRKYLVGAKGGCYYLNSSGNKTYVDKKFCNGISNISEVKVKAESNPSKTDSRKESPKKAETTDKTYLKGSRGGCYYLNSKGNKVYVDKELCN
jgi:endonuclease YncB( thermonuclease family)